MAEQMSIQKYANTMASKTSEWLQSSIANGDIKPLAGYDIGAEISSAMMMIMQAKDRTGRPALEVCTRESVMSAVRDMAIQGLSMVRKQCYPIVYGDQLQIQRSYFGTLSVFSRMFPNLTATANVVYREDEYEYLYDEIGDFNYISIIETRLENRDNEIVAAFGSIIDKNTKERVYGCVMTRAEIEKSWAKSKSKDHTVHKEFPQEMAKRTLLNRMCKLYVNTAVSVEPILMEAFQRTTDNEYENNGKEPIVPSDVSKAIRGKSQGEKGLEALLRAKEESVEVPTENIAEYAEKDADSAKSEKEPLNAPNPQNGKTIPKEEENASEAIYEAPGDMEEMDNSSLFDDEGNPENGFNDEQIPF